MESPSNMPTAADYARESVKPTVQFKERHLVDDLNRGAKTDSCKVCGCKITNLPQHLKWHNKIGA